MSSHARGQCGLNSVMRTYIWLLMASITLYTVYGTMGVFGLAWRMLAVLIVIALLLRCCWCSAADISLVVVPTNAMGPRPLCPAMWGLEAKQNLATFVIQSCRRCPWSSGNDSFKGFVKKCLTLALQYIGHWLLC